MKRALIVALVMGLSVVPLGGVEAKSKKKPKSVPLTFYLHFPSEGGTCGTSFMDLDPDKTDSGCGYTFQPANEIFHATGAQEALSRDWPATEGVPLKLDAKKPIAAQFALMNLFGQPASGQAVVDLKIGGMVGGKSVTLVEESVTIDMNPAMAGSNLAEFEVALPKNLSGKRLTSLNATTLVRGPNNFHYFDLNGDTKANIIIPTLK